VFERFTDEARRAVVVAQEEARELRAERIEPVHLLLALTRDPSRGGTALRAAGIDHDRLAPVVAAAGNPLDPDALAVLGVDLAQVRATAEATFGTGALDRGRRPSGGHIPFADGSKRVLEQALRAAVRHKERRLDSGHVLLGVLAVGDPTVGRVLAQLGIDTGSLQERAGGEPEVA
jgi:ATP-dependent Clp protease ATP-binding subunit ClpA